jgi:hypothetical protein
MSMKLDAASANPEAIFLIFPEPSFLSFFKQQEV